MQVYEGIPVYLLDSLASVAVERARTELFLPAFDLAAPFSGESLLLVTYYAFWAVPAIAVVAWLARLAVRSAAPFSGAERAAGAGLLAMAVLANMSFLRANLAERFGDAAVPVTLLAAWTVGTAAAWTSPSTRAWFLIVPAVLLVQMFAAAYAFSDVARELDTSGLSDSWGKIARRYATVTNELSGLPPAVWDRPDAHSGVLAPRATSARARARTIAFSSSGRRTRSRCWRGAGSRQGSRCSSCRCIRPSGTSSARSRGSSSSRCRSCSPMHASWTKGSSSTIRWLPDYLSDRYRDAGTIDVDEEPRLRVFVDAHRNPVRVEPSLGLPCFR